MSIRDCTSRPPSAEFDAGFETAFPGRSAGKHLARHCAGCGRLPTWCECLDALAKIPDLQPIVDRARGAAPPEASRALKSPGQARWPMVVVK
jgi:hypothetical protein